MTRKGYYSQPKVAGERIHCDRCRTWIALKTDDGIVRRDGKPGYLCLNTSIEVARQLMTEEGWTALGGKINKATPGMPLVWTMARCRKCWLVHWIDWDTGEIIRSEQATPELNERLAEMRREHFAQLRRSHRDPG